MSTRHDHDEQHKASKQRSAQPTVKPQVDVAHPTTVARSMTAPPGVFRTADILTLQQAVGNRAVQRMLARQRSAEPRQTDGTMIQRFSISQNPINWAEAVEAKASGEGTVGVIFVKDGAGNELVVKGTTDPTSALLFAEKLHKSAGIKSAKSRVIEPRERNLLREQLKQIALGHLGRTKQPDEALGQKVTGFFVRGNTIMVSAKMEGTTFDAHVKNDPVEAVNTLNRPGYMENLGKLHALDMFLGNGDRLGTGNLSNWMTAGNQVNPIDNYDIGSPSSRLGGGNQDATIYSKRMLKSIGNDSELQKMAMSRIDNLKTRMQNSLEEARKDPSILDQVMDENVIMSLAVRFYDGIIEGRDQLLRKFESKFGGRSSLKKTVTKLGKQYGGISWEEIKGRAKTLKQFKDEDNE